jgi:hypothetical protein
MSLSASLVASRGGNQWHSVLARTSFTSAFRFPALSFAAHSLRSFSSSWLAYLSGPASQSVATSCTNEGTSGRSAPPSFVYAPTHLRTYFACKISWVQPVARVVASIRVEEVENPK